MTAGRPAATVALVALVAGAPACAGEPNLVVSPADAAASTGPTPTPSPTGTPGNGVDGGVPVPVPDAGPGPTPGTPGLAIKVDGNHFVDGDGKTLRLFGVNRSGTEYQCIQGNGIFDGPNDDASIDAIVKWKANVVRVPLNEDCWLDINGVDPKYGGAAYQQAIVDFVKLINKKGLYVILELHWTAAGTQKSSAQQPMPDKDHTGAFWKSVAAAFKDNTAVLFDVFNEPAVTKAMTTTDLWTCWLSGCMVTSGGKTWPTPGMQELVDAVRSTGTTQPILLGGLAYANDLSGWLAHKPNDPANALAASFHVYNSNTCASQTCWDNSVKPVTAQVPLVTGEVGEDDCQHTFLDAYMGWADNLGASYLGWTWNTWGSPSATSCGSSKIVLIADFNGTPTPFGVGLRDHFAKVH